MKRPKHPCPTDCEKRRVGCRKTCQPWIDYEKAYAEFISKKEHQRILNEEVVKFRRDCCTKGIRQKRSK